MPIYCKLKLNKQVGQFFSQMHVLENYELNLQLGDSVVYSQMHVPDKLSKSYELQGRLFP